MSAAEQDRNRKQEPGQAAGGSGAAFSPGQADASFDQLLAQLESEQPGAGGGVSQIFSVPPPARDPGVTEAPAFTPQDVAGANAPGASAAPAVPAGTTGQLPVAPAPKQPAPLVPPEPEQAGEFTRIFTQLPTPRSAPPAILADVSAPPALAPQPGEFTQFFQTLNPPKATPAAPSPAPVETQQATAAPATQAFQPARSQASSPAPAASAAPVRPQDAHAEQPAASQPGAFTAFFQAAASTAPSHEPAASRACPPASEAPQPPAFAEPARGQPANAGGFTELLQSLGGESGPAPRAPLATPPPGFSPDRPDSFSPVASPPPQAFPPRVPERSPAFAPPPASRKPAAAPGAAPGEFTQLMQSLASPSSSESRSESRPGTPAQAPFFAGGAQVSSSGPSEFTRVIQGSAARSAEAPVATFAPAPQSGGGAAVGLPIAAPQMAKPAPPALPAAEGKTKLQAMMPWLLAINGVLLLLLIALAFLFLRRH